MRKSPIQRVVFQPTAYRGFQQGINQMVAAIRPTLGPLSRHVAIEPAMRTSPPELLDNGGVIARRILQLTDRDADVGAMFVRQFLWNLHEKAGDGTATAAVLFQSIYNEGIRYIAAGGNAMQLRQRLEEGMRLIDAELSRMTFAIAGQDKLAHIAETICYDPPLAKMLGEIFDIIGEYGRLDIRSGRGRDLEREYVEGMYWERGILSREMITDQTKFRATLHNAVILISDLKIDDPRPLVSLLRRAAQANIRSLLIVAGEFSDSVIGTLLLNNKPDKFQVIAVKTPGNGITEQAAALEDLAILTGGKPVLKVTKETLDQVTNEHLGQARRVWADRHNFGFVGGRGNPRALRQHIARLRAAFEQTEDPAERKKLQQRIGKLLGGSATLWIGGLSETTIKARQELAKRTAEAMRGAVREGVLPGGGVSLLACRPVLQDKLERTTDSVERAAYRILIKALEAPIRTIISNAGYEASQIMAEITQAGPGYGFDVTSGQVVKMTEAGIFDAAGVQTAAVRSAISSAALALTIDVLVHHKKPQQSSRP
jgi:chaperonin GroEL